MKSKTRPPPERIFNICSAKKENNVSRTAQEIAPRLRYKGEIMRIINQRRDRSVNFDNVEIHIDDTRILAFVNVNFTIVLGEYEIEERVREVFEEMHKAYTGALEIEEEMKKLKDFDVDKMPKIQGGFIRPIEPSSTVILPRNTVYEMPIS